MFSTVQKLGRSLSVPAYTLFREKNIHSTICKSAAWLSHQASDLSVHQKTVGQCGRRRPLSPASCTHCVANSWAGRFVSSTHLHSTENIFKWRDMRNAVKSLNFYFPPPIFTARCTLVQSAVLPSHVVCLSVCLSVCL